MITLWKSMLMVGLKIQMNHFTIKLKIQMNHFMSFGTHAHKIFLLEEADIR